MKYRLPVAKHSDCDLTDMDHMNKIRLCVDEFGLVDLECPEHGRVTEFDYLEFDSLEALEAWKAGER